MGDKYIKGLTKPSEDYTASIIKLRLEIRQDGRQDPVAVASRRTGLCE